MFNENKFIKIVLNKAKKAGLYQESKEELELYKKNNQIEYLYWAHMFVGSIKDNLFKYPLIRMAGATSVCAYLLGIHSINPVEHDLSNKFFFERHYKYNLPPRFDITVPQSMIKETIRLLNELTNNSVEIFTGGIFRFGDKKQFTIGIYGSNYLERCLKSLNIIKSNQSDYDCYEDDAEFINYVFKEDQKGYYLPNLAGCVPVSLSGLYEYINASKPKSSDDFAKLISLGESLFKDEKLVLKCLKDYGLEDTICSKEQVLTILNRYDIDEDRALLMLDTLIAGDTLFESDKLLLESNEVPKHIIEQLENIRYLGNLAFALQEVKAVYKMTWCKKLFENDFERILDTPYPDAFVGPFFYLDGRVLAHKTSMTHFNRLTRFFDNPISHFEYFNSLGIDGDYGNYPRGRVIFDNFHRKFIVYLDRTLNKNDIKMTILTTYGLEERRTVFRRDSHYTHDGL